MTLSILAPVIFPFSLTGHKRTHAVFPFCFARRRGSYVSSAMFIVHRTQESSPSPRPTGRGIKGEGVPFASRFTENFLRCCEYFGTMNRCYARGLTAVPPPLPEGEGRGEGEFCRLRPYGSSKGGPYIRTILSACTALLLASAATVFEPAATAAANGPDLAPLGPFPVGITTALLVDSNRTDAFTREPRSL